MSWDNLKKIKGDLIRTLDSFNWTVVESICQKLIAQINQEKEVLPDRDARGILTLLREKNQFRLMADVAEALISSGQTHPQIRRQHAQSLIDQGILLEAEPILRAVIDDETVPQAERIEARGLVGRIYKQLYVDGKDREQRKKNHKFLQQALYEYLFAYRQDARNYWHAINVVALIKLAEADEFPLSSLPDANQLAEEILILLDALDKEQVGPPPAWEIATAMESLIALGRYEEAEIRALDYSLSKEANAFGFRSTLRQLTEVWQLKESEIPGSAILPILHSALLRSEGGELHIKSEKYDLELANVEQIQDGFERIFGADRTQTLEWYEKGLESAKSIARIEKLNGKKLGTGWLVKASDFFPGRAGLLLVTNAHVVSNFPSQGFPPDQVRANFLQLNLIFEIDELVWSSPKEELDATFLSLKGETPDIPLTVDLIDLGKNAPSSRLYIMGYPGGRDLEFSIHDNHLIAYTEVFLHYRTPTEKGSSGSPVFDEDNWRVVGLHHRGKADMPRLDGTDGTYEANEGISLFYIKKAINQSN